MPDEIVPDQPARPSLRERQRELTRVALLDGARAAFEERGYTAVTIDDITNRAGTSRGTFYLHFTKATVLQELLLEAFGPAAPSGTRHLAVADLSSRPAIRSWLSAYVGVWQSNRRLARAWMEGDVTDPDLRAMTDRRISRAVQTLSERILATHHDHGRTITAEDARARAALMDLQLQYFCYHVVGRELDVPIDAGLTAMTEQWFRSLRPAAPTDDRNG